MRREDGSRPLDDRAAKFEADLAAGKRPRIEDFLDQSADRTALLTRLIASEVAHRFEEDDEPPTAEEYTVRFPDAPEAVDATFAPPAAPPMRFAFRAFHGEGGLSHVHTAVDRELDRVVAVKQPRITPGQDRTRAYERLRDEARISAKLEHTNIVPIYGRGDIHDSTEPCPFFAMRLVQGDTLERRTAQFHAENGDRSRGEWLTNLRDLLDAFVDVCDAVAFAHERKVIHRDLKPRNVMIGENGVTVVIDWGLALEIDDEPSILRALEERADGTIAFMSPEQASNMREAYAPSSDVYSLGSMLYSILVGRPAFGPEPGLGTDQETYMLGKVTRNEFIRPRQVSPRIPENLERVCLKAMTLDPAGRYTARELASDIRQWLADEPISICRDRWPDRVLRWGRKNRRAFGTSAVAVGSLVVALVGLASLLAYSRSSTETMNFRFRFEKAQALCEAGEVARGVAEFGQLLGSGVPGNGVLSSPDYRAAVERNLGLWTRYVRRPLGAEPHRGPVMATSLGGRDGLLMATGSRDKKVRIWSLDRDATATMIDSYSHEGWVSAVACGRSTDVVVSCGWDGKVYLWRRGQPHRLLPGQMAADKDSPSRPLNALAFSPDERFVVVGGRDSTLLCWDLSRPDDGPREIRVDPLNSDGPGSQIAALAFHPSGRTLAVGDIDGGIELISALPESGPTSKTERASVIDRKRKIGAAIYGLAFSPETGALGACGDDGVIRFWPSPGEPGVPNPDAAKSMAEGRHPSGLSLTALAFHPESNLFATAGADQFVYFWESENDGGKLILKPVGSPIRLADPTLSLAFAPRGRTLVTGGRDSIARLWKSPEPARTARRPPDVLEDHVDRYTPEKDRDPQQVPAVIFGGKGSGLRLMAAGWDATAPLWRVGPGLSDRRDLNPIATGSRTAGDKVLDVDLVRSDARLALIVNPGRVRVFELDPRGDGRQIADLPHPEVRAAAFDSSGHRVVSVSNDQRGLIRLWDLRQRDPESKPVEGVYESPINAVAFDPRANSPRFLIGSSDTQAVLIDGSRGDLDHRTVVAKHESSVNDVAFSHDGSWALTASADRTAAVWNAISPKPKKPLASVSHNSYVNAVAIDQSGKTLLTCSDDGTAQVWDVKTSKPLGPARRHADRRAIRAGSIDPEGRFFATGGLDGVVELWSLMPGDGGVVTEDAETYTKTLTGLRIDDDGRLKQVEVREWQELRAKSR